MLQVSWRSQTMPELRVSKLCRNRSGAETEAVSHSECIEILLDPLERGKSPTIRSTFRLGQFSAGRTHSGLGSRSPLAQRAVRPELTVSLRAHHIRGLNRQASGIKPAEELQEGIPGSSPALQMETAGSLSTIETGIGFESAWHYGIVSNREHPSARTSPLDRKKGCQ